MVGIAEYLRILDDRPFKLTAEDVDYQPAPQGSAMRCGVCHHFFRRATDGFTTCEIFRSPETDEEGVNPAYRCGFYTLDAQVHPLLEEETKPAEEESDIPY